MRLDDTFHVYDNLDYGKMYTFWCLGMDNSEITDDMVRCVIEYAKARGFDHTTSTFAETYERAIEFKNVAL